MTDWHTLDQTYIMPTVRRLPIAIDKAEGNYLYDTEGNRYLDLFTGLAVNVLGHSHPAILRALREQGERFLHISNLFLNPRDPARTTLGGKQHPGQSVFRQFRRGIDRSGHQADPQMDSQTGRRT